MLHSELRISTYVDSFVLGRCCKCSGTNQRLLEIKKVFIAPSARPSHNFSRVAFFYSSPRGQASYFRLNDPAAGWRLDAGAGVQHCEARLNLGVPTRIVLSVCLSCLSAKFLGLILRVVVVALSPNHLCVCDLILDAPVLADLSLEMHERLWLVFNTVQAASTVNKHAVIPR